MSGGKGFLGKIIKGAEWAQIRDYLSPAILDVVRPTDLKRQTIALATPLLRRGRWKKDRDEVFEHISSRLFQVTENLGPSQENTDSVATAQRVLELYFFQIQHQDVAILDLRSSAFSAAGSNVQWNPSPLFIRWDPEFIQALREIYEGFYNDSPTSYESGLRTLNLLPAQDIFTQHFGQGDQRQVAFQLSHFHDTFHQTFTRCLEHEVNLHGNFLALGLMLACLYEHLETLSVHCNVRGAYEKVSAL